MKEENAAYRAVREGAGWFPLSSETAFEMSGKDAVSFLHGMVSNDISGLSEGEGCYAACLTPTGKMMTDLRVYAFSDRLLVVLSKNEKAKLIAHLDKFIFTEEVIFTDLEEGWTLLSVQGPKARKTLETLTGQGLPEKPHAHLSCEVNGLSLRIFCETHTGEEGFDLCLSRNDFPRFLKSLEEKGKVFGLREVDEATRDILRIEAAIPRFGKEMDETTIPLEAHLEEAVSFTKGCYVGQEVIARIKHIGHVNRQLVGLKLERPAPEGGSVLEGEKEVGRVTSSCRSLCMQSPIALAMVRREAAKVGRFLNVKTEETAQQALVTPIPFYARP